MTELVVQVEDASLVADLKRAIKMLRGVSGVTIPKRQKRTGIEKGLDDIKKGNVYHAKNSQDLIKYSGRFKKSYKRCIKLGCDSELFHSDLF